ncbi:MAG: leucine-rich repeat protein [Treponema sp.]|nr:leucine-rich repeat protein [Treponema sp.]
MTTKALLKAPVLTGLSVAIFLFCALLPAACKNPSSGGGGPDEAILESIEISGEYKNQYVLGEELDPSGLVVTGTWSDGTTAQLDPAAYGISGYDPNTLGEQTLTVIFEGKSASFTVAVAAPASAVLQSIEISGEYKNQYVLGEELDPSGLVVTGIYSDGTTETRAALAPSNYTISGYDPNTLGEQTLSITFEGKSATFTVSVAEPVLQSITLGGEYKTQYELGEELDPSGLVVTGTWSDGTTAQIDLEDCEISGYDSNAVGGQILTVTFEDKSASFTVAVAEPPGAVLQSIEISGNKPEYEFGESLALTVTGIYSDGTTETRATLAPSKYVISGYDPNALGEKTVTVTKKDSEKTASFTATTPWASIKDWLTKQTGGNGQEALIPLPVRADLAAISLADILSAIDQAAKYVDLDLSGCGMSGTEFNPGAAGSQYITGLTLPNAAKSIAAGIGEAAPTFNSFTGLRTLSASGLETVNRYAFSYGSRLVSIYLPNVTEIGEHAFVGCGNIETLDLPKVTKIGGYAFSDCTFKTVSLPAAVEIGGYAFGSCRDLETVTLPKVTKIGGYAFSDCRELKTVSLPEAVEIGNNAFEDCFALTTVNLPKVTSIGGNAFENCGSLTTVSLLKVTEIGSAFASCRKLVSISLPEVTSIGDYAFSYCESLATVVLSKVTSIGYQAFKSCTSLVSISLPELTSIGSFAFDGCTNLAAVNLPKVTSIGESAFKSTGAKSLTLSLGAAAPNVDVNLFNGVDSKNVTVKVPAGAAGYGTWPTDTNTENWGNGFRGKGWNGSACSNGWLNNNIALTITTQQ